MRAIAVLMAGVLLTMGAAVQAQADDSAKHCTSLSGQWDAAKTAHAANPNFAAAKVWAKSAARDCTKDTQSRREDGANEFIKALKLLGVTPK